MKIILLACLAGFATAYIDSSDNWRNYKRRFGKQYKSHGDEVVARSFTIRNSKQCNRHNMDYENGKCTFTVNINEFTDTNLTETIAMLCRTIVPDANHFTPRLLGLENLLPILNLPLSVDYTYLLTPVVSQKQCGSCWAFATVAQLEALYQIVSFRYKYTLSPQYLIDCNDDTNGGCKGGWPTSAMNFILDNGVITNANYPYAGVQNDCQSPLPPFVRPTVATHSAEFYLNGDEEKLKAALNQYGPLVVVIMASPVFLTYQSGIFYDSLDNCPRGCNNVNHAMLLVGYGVELLSGFKYWILRNSWGKNWGEGGYVRMLRDGSNNCNVACYAMFMTTN